MDVLEKLQILSAAAKYDASCSSSGSSRENNGGIGNGATAGICHSWSDDGRCVSLLKILFSNHCIFDCAYCLNRSSNDLPRTSFTVEEVVDLTINFYRRNYIEGLFLSSGVLKNPDYTMECLLKIIKTLRIVHKYNGYIHLKAIPYANSALVREAGLYADRLSINIELPSSQSLKLLAPQKNYQTITNAMTVIGANILENQKEKKKYKKTPLFSPAGQSTQLIIGASPENDLQIVNLSSALYQKFNLKRVYYSAYIPVNNDSRLPAIINNGTPLTPPLKREHRLYQADWLMRFYHFQANEIVDQAHPYLDEEFDPKVGWALRNLHYFPIEINKAPYEVLLRIPGLGVRSAKRIIAARRFSRLNFENLKRLGVVLKRARYFITCNGNYFEKLIFDQAYLRQRMIDKNYQPNQQLSLLAV